MPPNVDEHTDISNFPACEPRRESRVTSPEYPDPDMEFLLEEAIEQASIKTLQNTLIEICGAENVGLPAMSMADDLLLVDTWKVKYLSAEESSEEESGEEEEPSEDEVSSGAEEQGEHQSNRTFAGAPPKNASTSTASAIPRAKKFRLRYAICEGCEEEFDVSVNAKGDCDRWHDGDLEVNTQSGVWKNWARESYESFDTSENRRKFPLAFSWSCCHKDSLIQGCRRTRHVEKNMPAKRLRYS